MDQKREAAQKLYDGLFPAANDIVKAGVQHAPMLMLLDEENGLHVIADAMLLGKDALTTMHRKAALLPGIAFSVLVYEAWMHEARKDDAAAMRVAAAIEAGKVHVEDLPVKSECVAFALRSGGRVFYAQCKIDRAANALVKGELMEHGVKGAQLSGRMV